MFIFVFSFVVTLKLRWVECLTHSVLLRRIRPGHPCGVVLKLLHLFQLHLVLPVHFLSLVLVRLLAFLFLQNYFALDSPFSKLFCLGNGYFEEVEEHVELLVHDFADKWNYDQEDKYDRADRDNRCYFSLLHNLV